MSSSESRDPDAESSKEGAQPWFKDGLGFKCTMCGNCCTGPPGAVWFDLAEGEAMARVLGTDLQTFLKQHARRINGRLSLRERHTRHGYDCVFLDRETRPGQALCRVYTDRPSQCRTWPFWAENMGDAEAWEQAREQTPCPGMGSPDPDGFVSVDSIIERLNESIETDRRTAAPDW